LADLLRAEKIRQKASGKKIGNIFVYGLAFPIFPTIFPIRKARIYEHVRCICLTNSHCFWGFCRTNIFEHFPNGAFHARWWKIHFYTLAFSFFFAFLLTALLPA